MGVKEKRDYIGIYRKIKGIGEEKLRRKPKDERGIKTGNKEEKR